MYRRKSVSATDHAATKSSKRSKRAKRAVKNDKFGTLSSSTSSSGWINVIQDCPVYHPTLEEFDDPLVFVKKIAPEASKYGICKIVCPLNSSTPAGVVLMNEGKRFKFTTQVQPLRLGKWGHGDKISFFNRGRNYTLRDFEIMANKEAARRYCVSGCLPWAYLEREFWDVMTNGKKGTVEYGINVDGSAFSSSSADPLSGSNWNLKALPHLNSCALRLLEKDIPGVTKPMLYIGMLFSMFAWHVEDHYLSSINFLHCGAPKTWYGVPSSAALEFEKVAQHYVYGEEILSAKNEDGAFNILADKTTMFSPEILLQHGVPVCKTVQIPGEFVITFPRAYHAGFSHGFNCGEAVNFATNEWFPFGTEASQRYALLGRLPIIPYEELLCKEAMLLYDTGTKAKADDTVSVSSLAISFVILLRLHHFGRWRIKELKPSLKLQTKSKGTILCTLCRRDCYVGHYTCKCFPDPICLFHESLNCCPCDSNSRLIIRDDVVKMEAAAKSFAQGKGINHQVEKQMKRFSYLFWKSSKFVHQVEDEYVPFTKKGRRCEALEKSRIRWRFSKNGVPPKCSKKMNQQKDHNEQGPGCSRKELYVIRKR